MAITIYQTDDGRNPALEYLPCSAMVPKVGMALKMSEGQLAAAGGTDVPTYLSMTERESVCEAGELIPVMRILGDIIFETPTPEGFAEKPGGKVQLAADGLGIANATGGCAEIVYTDDEMTRFRLGTAGAV